jgi:hypothetical protein
MRLSIPGSLFAAILIALTTSVRADTLGNANALFNFAEDAYPELLSPARPETQAIQGFYVRYYSSTDIYLGVQGDKVWALGEQLGPGVIYVGELADFNDLQLSPTDISDITLSNRQSSCSYYADTLVSTVRDIKRDITFNGNLQISVDPDSNECVFISNSIPNHDFNDSMAAFASDVAEVSSEFRIPLEPAFASNPTDISLSYDNGILLNGVKLDLLAAACFGVADEKIGCNDMAQAWRFDPMHAGNSFGTDAHNAHTQPDGSYHYHGNPQALFDQQASSESPLIGFAADGFPIFGSFINDNGQVRAVTSSYRLRSGSRPAGNDDPGGNYDGSYVDDYEYVEGLGDLDQCNGMMRNGSYGYYVVDQYPWVLACFQGTPHSSFEKSADDSGTGQGGGQQGGGPGGMPPPPG